MVSQINLLKNKFPSLKLSYEAIIHKKVLNSQFIVLVPKGKKCFLWFYMYFNKPTCFVVETKNNNIHLSVINCCFGKQLAFNTIVYGTLFEVNKNKFFSVEDIYYYKGEEIVNKNWQCKLNIIKELFDKYIKVSQNYNTKFVSIGLPILCKNNEEVEQLIARQPYKIEYLQYKLFSKINSYLILHISKFNIKSPVNSGLGVKTNIFTVKPDYQNDIYNLYKGKSEFIGTACIPSYTISVMMNKLFRSIKENDNLDALEESDDEEEFQRNDIDKFVDMSKEIKMKCIFNNKFKKWIPVEILN